MASKIIFGLGNPGSEYAKTRHNIGFSFIDYFVNNRNLKNTTQHKYGLIFKSSHQNNTVLLVKPNTYMNLSGKAVLAISNEFSVDISKDILIVYDDFHIDFGQIRFRPQGSDAGHNGIKSIQYELQSSDFHRCRLGIGPFIGNDLVDFVLASFSDVEQHQLTEIFKVTISAIYHWLERGIQDTMNQYNSKKII